MRFKRVYAGLVASVMALTAVATPLTDNLPFAVFGGSLSLTAGAETYGDYEYYDYGNGTVMLTDYKGSDETVVIPSEIDGKKVTDIGSYVFGLNSSLTEVTIPDTVKVIGGNAFLGCTSLKEVTIPSSVIRIGTFAFGYYRDDATREYVKVDGFKINYVKNSEGHYYAAKYGFTDESCLCTSVNDSGELWISQYAGKDTEYTIPAEIDGKKVTGIAGEAFKGNGTLTKVTIPDTVTTIGSEAFAECLALKEISIPASVTNISERAFGYVYDEAAGDLVKAEDFKLNYVKHTAGHLYALENGFTDEGCLTLYENSNGTLLVSKYYGSDTEFVIPSEAIGKKITKIGSEAFAGSSIVSVTIPDTVYGIDARAFLNCPALKEFTVPPTVTYINDKALGYSRDDDGNYTKVDGFKLNYTNNTAGHSYAVRNGFTDESCLITTELDDGTLSIKSYTGNDTEYVIPSEIDGKKITKIGNYAFEDCTNLESVTIPSGITDIGYRAFEGCSSLSSVSIPDTVTYIGACSFFGCTALKTVTLPASVENIYSEAFGYYMDPETNIRKTVDGFKINYVSNSEAHRYAAENGFTDETYIATREFNDGTLAITRYIGKDTEYTVPAEINGKKVTWIEYGAFKDCTDLTSVTITSGITNLGSEIFNGCTSLTSVTIPDTVTGINDKTFYNCPALKSVTIPSSITSIGKEAFGYYYDEDAKKTVKTDGFTINFEKYTEGHRYAADNGFTDEGYLTTEVLDDGTLSVTKYAGSGKSFTVPSEIGGKKVTRIGYGAFQGCKSLENVTIPDGITIICSYAFSSCSNLKSVSIPDGVTEIGGGAFGYCTGLTSVNIPGSVTVIDNYAFNSCTGLTSVNIPDGVTEIGIYAFFNCTALKAVSIPASVTRVGEYAFGYYDGGNDYAKTDGFTISYVKNTSGHYYAAANGFTDECSCIVTSELNDGTLEIIHYIGTDTDYTVPSEIDGKKVTRIGKCAFENCTSFESVTIPSGITKIGSSAFEGCSSLSSVSISDTVTHIAYDAFVNCFKLTEVTVPESVTKIDDNALGYSYDEGSGEFIKVDGFKINYVKYSEAHRYALENGFTNEGCIITSELDDGTLTVDGYYGNETEIVIPSEIDGKKVTRINSNAFYNRTKLTSVTIPDGIIEIGYSAFLNCTALKTVTIPASVKNIREEALGYRYDDAGENIIKVDGFKINYVKNTEGHRYAVDNGFTDEDCFVTGENGDGTLYIKRCVTSKENYEVPSEINGKAVTEIGYEAFMNCTNLKTVTLPDGIIYIETGAFEGCTSLTSINIPDSVTNINRRAFHNCRALKTVTIPENVRYIGEKALGYYFDKESWSYVKVGGFKINYVRNTYGHYYAAVNGFTDESFISAEELDDGTLSIKSYAGNDKEYTIPSEIDGKKVTQIGKYAFENAGVEKVIIPDGVTSINSGAFFGCANLMSVTIPNGVTYIGSGAFFDCTALKTVTIPASVTTINGEALGYGNDKNWDMVKTEGFKINCYEGTVGEQYAKEHEFEYKLIPSEVRSLKAIAKDTSSVSFKWAENAYADGYIVEQYKGGQWIKVAAVKSGDKTEYTANGLNAATMYTFRVRAYRLIDGEALYSEYSRIAVITELDNVKGFVSSAASSSAIALGWERNVNASGYVIEQYKGGQWTEIARTKNNYTLTFTVKGLADYTAYSFRVKAYKTVGGVTVYSEYANTKAKTDLGNVAEFMAAAAGTTAVKLDWSRNTKATAYVIEQYKGGQWTEIARTKNNYTLTFTVKGLAEGTPYSFRVKSVRTADGVTEESVYKNAKATTLLSTVKGGKVTAADSSQLTLEWNRNVNASGYVIEQYRGGAWTVIARTKNNYTLTFTVKGLKGDTTYSFRMRSYKNIGSDTLYSDYVRIVGTTGLASVAGFKGTAVSQTSVKLSWSKNANAEGYVIEQYKGGKWTEITTTKSLTATVNGLAKGTAYSFRIKAYRTVDGAKEFSTYVTAKVTTAK